MPTLTPNEQLLVSSKLMQHYRVFTPLSAGTDIQAVNDADGNIELITLGNDGNLYNLWPDPASDTGWQITSLNTSALNLGKVTSFTAIQSAAGNITVLAQFAGAPNTTYTLSDERWSPGWQPVGSQSTAVKTAAFSGLFSVQNGTLTYKPTGGSAIVLSGNIQVSTSYVTGRNFAGFLEVFILGTDNSLYHVRAAPDLTQPQGLPPSPEAAPNWTQMVQLNPVQSDISLQFTLLALANDNDGYSKLFGVTTTDDLYAVWQDAETSDWSFQEIEIPDYNPQSEGGPTEISVFMTEITVVDALGVPRPQTTVTLWTSDQTPARVNGLSTNLDSLTPYMCSANSAGKVTVLIESETLDAPMLKVTTDFMVGDEYVSVEPNAYIQEALLSVTAASLTNATNLFSGLPATVISPSTPPATLTAVASAVSQCMSLTGPPIAPSAPVTVPGPDGSAAVPKYLARNRNLRGLKYVSGSTGKFEHRIDLSQVKEQHWRFVFDHENKNHRFETLTRDQAESLLAEHKSALKPAATTDSWLDVDWGDVLEDVENVGNIVVTTIVDVGTNVVSGIQTLITVVINGVTQVYELTVTSIEQVFDIVEGIFEAVGTYFEDLFNWLAFIFDWSDIQLTQQAIYQLILDVTLPFAGQVFGAGGTLNAYLAGQIQSFQASLNSIFSGFLNSPGINNASSILALQPTMQTNSIEDQIAGTNLALAALIDNPNSAVFTNSGDARPLQSAETGTNDTFTTLINDLAASLGPFLDDPAFSNAMAYFQAAGDNPDQFLQNTLSGILSTIQGVLNVGLNVAAAVINAVFTFVQSALNILGNMLTATVYLPLASELYTQVTGGNMTILGLFSFIIAIPATIAYKIYYSAPPFASQDAVNQFIQEMNQALSPVSAAAKGKQQLSAAVPVPTFISGFLGIILLCTYPIYGICEGVLDAWPVPPDTPVGQEGVGLLSGVVRYSSPSHALSWYAIVCEWVLFISSLPSSLAAPSCADAASTGTLAWLVGGLSPALDHAWYKASGIFSSTGVIMRNSGTLGTGTDWILACVQFGMLCSLTTKQVQEGTANGLATTQAFFAATPGIFKFLRLPDVNKWPPALPILGVMDFFGDSMAGFLEKGLLDQMAPLPRGLPADAQA